MQLAVPEEHVVSASRGGEVMLLDSIRGYYYALNELGGQVWDRLCDGVDVPSIIDELAHATSTDRVVVERDVNAFLAKLKTARLVRKP